MSSVYQDLAAELVRTRRIAESRGAPQLIHSTVEGGAIPIRSGDGQLTGILGEAYDGSYGAFSLAGPNPPTPSAPEVTQIAGGATVRILGTWVDVLVAPMDFARWEVYAAKEPTPSAVFDNFKTDLTSPRGGEVGISLERDTDYWIWITARTASGKIGASSRMVGPVRAGKMVEADLGFSLADIGGNTIHRGDAEPAGPHLYGDLWYKTPSNQAYRWEPGPDRWVEILDARVTAALDKATDALQGAGAAASAAEAAANVAAGKTTTFRQPDQPPSAGRVVGDEWIDIDDDNARHTWMLITSTTYGWVRVLIGGGSIRPNSLIASDVVATGTISAALLETFLVLATTIIAGNPNGNHVQINQNGMRVFIADPVDGIPNEVIRLGTETGDILGVTDRFGRLVMSVDDTGRISGQEVYANRVYAGGVDVMDAIANSGGRPVARFRGNLGYNQPKIYVEPYGVAEVGAELQAGRTYRIDYRFGYWPSEGGDEFIVHMIYSMGNEGDTQTQAPPIVAKTAIDNASIAKWYSTQAVTGRLTEPSGFGTFIATRTTRYRIGVALQRNTPGSLFGTATLSNQAVEIIVTDMGQTIPMAGGFTNMGGTLLNPGEQPPPPPPPANVSQQYHLDLAPVGRGSWTGSGQLMNWVGNDVYQGYHPSNGDTRGQFIFNLPPISGWVDRVDLWLYFRHWYFNSGGTVRIGLTDQRGVFTGHSFKPLYDVPGYPKPGGREIFLPSDWYPFFRGANNNSFNGRATVITLGPGGGTNQVFYGIATDARLRIHYTQ